jgi:lysophospholipase L1-like esterase
MRTLIPRALLVQVLVMAALLVWGLVPPRAESGASDRLRDTLRNNLMNQADYEQMERGYYEQLLSTGRQFGSLEKKPAKAGGPRLMCEDVADFRMFVLKPGHSAVQPDGRSWTTNEHGMRDRPYSKGKPPRTVRVALVGDSIGAGWGVGDGEGFEPALEHWLDERSQANGGPAVEVLNLAVPGHSPGQRWEHFMRTGWAFEPDLVIFESTQADVGWDERRLAFLLPKHIGWDTPAFREILTQAGLRPGKSGRTYEPVLRTLRWELTANVYQAAARECRARNVPAMWLLIPRVGRPVDPTDRQRLVDVAQTAGFTEVVDISDTYDGIEATTLAARPDDYHPNVQGHAMLAQQLMKAFEQRPSLLRTVGGTKTASIR